ncbi:MAG: hypothetical protein GAK37_00942 [Pseudomonas sp.]|nr:MAG: hypothetical protein GAK37_00942 [Pseudomonas sp.]
MKTVDLVTYKGGTLSIYSIFIKYQKLICIYQSKNMPEPP